MDRCDNTFCQQNYQAGNGNFCMCESQVATCLALERFNARRDKGSAKQQTDNSDYTAALEEELKQMYNDAMFVNDGSTIDEMATRLNAAIQKQHCA